MRASRRSPLPPEPWPSLALTQGASCNGGMESHHHRLRPRAAYHRREQPARHAAPQRCPLPYGRTPSFYGGAPDEASAVWQPEFSLGQLYNKGLFLLGYCGEIEEFARSVLESRPPSRGTARRPGLAGHPPLLEACRRRPQPSHRTALQADVGRLPGSETASALRMRSRFAKASQDILHGSPQQATQDGEDAFMGAEQSPREKPSDHRERKARSMEPHIACYAVTGPYWTRTLEESLRNLGVSEMGAAESAALSQVIDAWPPPTRTHAAGHHGHRLRGSRVEVTGMTNATSVTNGRFRASLLVLAAQCENYGRSTCQNRA